MSKITFNTGEKNKLIQYINKHEKLTVDIELIKKKYAIIEILHQCTNITSTLINIIFEYTYEIILINCFINMTNNSVVTDRLIIELKDQFKIILIKEQSTRYDIKIRYSINMFNNTNMLFKYKNVKMRKNDTIIPKNIVDRKSRGQVITYSLEHFIDYYMMKYYDKPKPYIKNLYYPDDNYYGIYKNTYYQVCGADNKYVYFHVIRMLDHQKIKQMIIIVKLFVDLLSKN